MPRKSMDIKLVHSRIKHEFNLSYKVTPLTTYCDCQDPFCANGLKTCDAKLDFDIPSNNLSCVCD